MSGEAVARGYDGIESCASYYSSSASRYRLEAGARVTCRFRRESTGAVGRSPHDEM